MLQVLLAGCTTPRPVELEYQRTSPPDPPDLWQRRMVRDLRSISHPMEQAMTIALSARIYPPLTRLPEAAELKSAALAATAKLDPEAVHEVTEHLDHWDQWRDSGASSLAEFKLQKAVGALERDEPKSDPDDVASAFTSRRPLRQWHENWQSRVFRVLHDWEARHRDPAHYAQAAKAYQTIADWAIEHGDRILAERAADDLERMVNYGATFGDPRHGTHTVDADAVVRVMRSVPDSQEHIDRMILLRCENRVRLHLALIGQALRAGKDDDAHWMIDQWLEHHPPAKKRLLGALAGGSEKIPEDSPFNAAVEQIAYVVESRANRRLAEAMKAQRLNVKRQSPTTRPDSGDLREWLELARESFATEGFGPKTRRYMEFADRCALMGGEGGPGSYLLAVAEAYFDMDQPQLATNAVLRAGLEAEKMQSPNYFGLEFYEDLVTLCFKKDHRLLLNDVYRALSRPADRAALCREVLVELEPRWNDIVSREIWVTGGKE